MDIKRQKERELLAHALLSKKKNPRAFSGKKIGGRKHKAIRKRDRRLRKISLSLSLFDS